jgi:hypothetical protein
MATASPPSRRQLLQRVAQDATTLSNNCHDTVLRAVYRLLGKCTAYNSYVDSYAVCQRGWHLMLAVEYRCLPAPVFGSLPFLRLVQIEVPEQSQGDGTRLLRAVEQAASSLGLQFMVECVGNKRWREGWFDKRMAPAGCYSTLPCSPECYYIFV